MSDAPLVRLTGLSKAFVKARETITIFDRLALAIPHGDFIAVMGPSGSGKTTLLNLLGGVDRPDDGAIDVPRPGARPLTGAERRISRPWSPLP